MNALTICQPWAELIARGEKRVENRTWPWRAPPCWLAIHAGKGRKFLKEGDEERYPGMALGAVVAAAFFHVAIEKPKLATWASLYPSRWDWLPTHAYAEGPWCWVFSKVVRLPEPIPLTGQRGIFELPDRIAKRLRELTTESSGDDNPKLTIPSLPFPTFRAIRLFPS